MPDRGQAITDIELIDLSDWDVSQSRQDMELQRAEPSTGLSIPFEFRLPGLKGVLCHISKQVQIALGFEPPFLTLSNRIQSVSQLKSCGLGPGASF
ncbi:hypothetical protein NBRC116590_31720 [Pelagimonas sp. KU-00592-HH]